MKHHLTLGSRIVLLVVFCIIPACLSGGFVAYHAYVRERNNVERNLISTTKALMLAIDRDLASMQMLLLGLAPSPVLDDRDLTRFYFQASALLHNFPGANIILADKDAQQIINTMRPLGASLPKRGSIDLVRRVFAEGRALTSDLFFGNVRLSPTVSVDVPVIRDGRVIYDIGLSFSPERLNTFLLGQNLPDGWQAGIFDRHGIFLAGTGVGNTSIGEPGAPALVRRISEVPEGFIQLVPSKGLPSSVGFSRSAVSGWTVAISVPTMSLMEELNKSLWLTAIVSCSLLLIGIALAGWMGRRITQSFKALTGPARALGRGEPVPTIPFYFREADEVGKALANASGLLRQRSAALTETNRLLAEAKEKAEAANRAKSTFLAHMSHEIRTPMNAMLGFTQIMQRSTTLAPQDRESLDIIQRSGHNLLALINDVLEMSKIEAGRTEFASGPCDVHALLDDLHLMFKGSTAAKGLNWESTKSGNLPRQVMTDGNKLRQILINLLGNAVKFTRAGGISVRMHMTGEDSLCRHLMIEVSDTGPGIPAEEHHTLFQPFQQTATGAKTGGGTGLGLAISRRYARLMGGDLTLVQQTEHGDAGSGCTFRLEIPVMDVPQTCTPAERRPQRRVVGLQPGQGEIRILIADDKPDNRLFLQRLLEPIGFSLCQAINGLEALALAQSWQPHLILMDIVMPEMDGCEAIRQIKSVSIGNAVSIIALSASAFEEHREEILECGADDFLRKPASADEVLDIIARTLNIKYVDIHEENNKPIDLLSLQLRPEMKEQMPSELVNAMLEAVHCSDDIGLPDLIDRLPADQGELAAILRHHVGRFDWDALEAFLESRNEA